MTNIYLPVVDVFSPVPKVELRRFELENIVSVNELKMGGFQGLLITIAILNENEDGHYYADVTVCGETYDLYNCLNGDIDYYLVRSSEELQNRFGYSRGWPIIVGKN